MAQDFEVVQGATNRFTLRWEDDTPVFRAVTAITQAAPAVITAASHGIPEGWRAAVVSVKGMTAINAANTPPKSSDMYRVHVIDANTVSLPELNAASFKAYTSGGYLYYMAPVDLTGFTARLSIKTKVGGTLLDSLTTENGGVVIDEAAKTITLVITATDSAAYTWKRAVYDLEMISPLGVVTRLLSGAMTLSLEVTT